MSDDLQPLAPSEALEMWLDRQRSEKADASIQSYRYRINQFTEWCAENGTLNLNSLDGRDLFRFDSYRRRQDLSPSTLNNQLGTLRQFLAFCEDIEAVEAGLSAKLDVPELSKAERANTEKLTSTRAETIQESSYATSTRNSWQFVTSEGSST